MTHLEDFEDNCSPEQGGSPNEVETFKQSECGRSSTITDPGGDNPPNDVGGGVIIDGGGNGDPPDPPRPPPVIHDGPCPCVITDFAIGPIYREEGICYRVINVFRDCKPVGTPPDPGYAATLATFHNDGWSFLSDPIRQGDTCDCATGMPCVNYSLIMSKPCPNEIDPDDPTGPPPPPPPDDPGDPITIGGGGGGGAAPGAPARKCKCVLTTVELGEIYQSGDRCYLPVTLVKECRREPVSSIDPSNQLQELAYVGWHVPTMSPITEFDCECDTGVCPDKVINLWKYCPDWGGPGSPIGGGGGAAPDAPGPPTIVPGSPCECVFISSQSVYKNLGGGCRRTTRTYKYDCRVKAASDLEDPFNKQLFDINNGPYNTLRSSGKKGSTANPCKSSNCGGDCLDKYIIWETCVPTGGDADTVSDFEAG